MSFVAVIESRTDTELFQHQNATDAQQILLLDTVLPVAAVKLMGNDAVELAVHVEVGVEKI